jgi:hypothetical protein
MKTMGCCSNSSKTTPHDASVIISKEQKDFPNYANSKEQVKDIAQWSPPFSLYFSSIYFSKYLEPPQ